MLDETELVPPALKPAPESIPIPRVVLAPAKNLYWADTVPLVAATYEEPTVAYAVPASLR